MGLLKYINTKATDNINRDFMEWLLPYLQNVGMILSKVEHKFENWLKDI